MPLALLSIFAFAACAHAQDAAPEVDPYDQSKVPLEVDSPDPGLAKIVLIAGSKSHGPGDHEHFAGMAILMAMLKQTPGVWPVMARDGWPKNEKIFDGARAIVFYCDGGGGHPVLPPARLKLVGEHIKRGAGFAGIHYGIEVQKDNGGPEFLAWTGGYFEAHWSVNPHWTADFSTLPEHPVTRGVKPFRINDEWYYHMRFREGMAGVTPILSAHPPASTLNRPDGPHSGNPAVRAAVARGEAQHVMWVSENAGGTRGFGFTGGHVHKNWGDENFRRVVVNALLWIAKVEIPPDGAPCALDPADVMRNLDDKGRRPVSKPVPKEFRASGKPRDVKAWAFIGPFPNANNAGFAAAYPPEQGVDLKASHPGRDGAVAWRKVEADGEGLVDTQRVMGETHTNSASYFYALLDSPRGQPVNFGIGSDDGVKVWLNGKLVHQNDVARGVTRDEDAAWGTLNAGENTLLVKLTNGGGGGGLIVSVKADGVAIRAPEIGR
jgi:hypothetical protein